MPFSIKGKNSLIGDDNPLENEAKLKIFPLKVASLIMYLIYSTKKETRTFFTLKID